MRPICLVRSGDKVRTALVLSYGGQTIGIRGKITVAGITSTVRGLPAELPVGPLNGLDHESVVNLEDIQTIRQGNLGRLVGVLLDTQEQALQEAIIAAFDLDLLV